MIIFGNCRRSNITVPCLKNSIKYQNYTCWNSFFLEHLLWLFIPYSIKLVQTTVTILLQIAKKLWRQSQILPQCLCEEKLEFPFTDTRSAGMSVDYHVFSLLLIESHEKEFIITPVKICWKFVT